MPVVFAEPYIRWQRGLAFTVITAGLRTGYGCAGPLHSDCQTWSSKRLVGSRPRSSSIAVPLNALHLMVIVWNNAAALRTSEGQLAERAAELAASRTRLITAADEERRRLERDLHDGAQQHLVALSVLVQLARNAERDRCQPLLTEASELVDTAIAEIRRLAHGIYPPLLISGGLAEALPALAARASGPRATGPGAASAATRLRPRPRSITAAAKRCRMPPNTAAPPPPSRSPPVADEQTLTLTISDTGRGFDPATMGMGLTNMTDRLSAIGGRLEIDTAPGRGTRITAAVDAPAEPAN